LLGGSFNPAHEGHAHISKIALKRLGLDQVWWLVSPQNPLKSSRNTAAYSQRFAMAAKMADHPRIKVSDFELRAGTRYTIDTLTALKRRYPDHQFVWLMGADNLAGFHKWRNWQEIANLLPLAIIDRPGNAGKALSSTAASRLRRYRMNEQDGSILARAAAPAWMFLTGPTRPDSSTALRDAGIWP